MTGDGSAVAMQDTIKHTYYNKLLPKLDALFSELVTNETVVRIDKLEVDLGKIDKDKFELELVEKTIANIEKQLGEKLQFDVNTSNSVTTFSTHQSAVDEFIYFLEHGYFSWRSRHKQIALLEKALMEDNIAVAALKNNLNTLVSERTSVVNRLVFQFSDEFLDFLSQCFVPGFFAKEVLLITQKTFPADVTIQDKIAVRNYIWRILFVNLSLTSNELQLTILSKTIRFIALAQNTSLENVLQSIGKTNLSIDVLDQLKIMFEKEIKEEKLNTAKHSAEYIVEGGKIVKNKQQLTDENKTSAENNANINKPINADNNANAETISNISHEKEVAASIDLNETGIFPTPHEKDVFADKNITSKSLDNDEPIYLELAGIIILHTFLVPFFDTLRLIENKKFLSEEALHKAVQLMGYLATGEIIIEEQFLVLPKLLCGMEITAPVQKIIISDEEKQECDSLLKQVIEHWSVLKNTSPNGLRNNFLKREGKLTKGGLGWQLDLEHKTWDILLAKLPWGYSLIKLPWMKEFLFVNWS
jgi:hypothetical protein